MTSRYRSNLFTKLAQANQLSTPYNTILSNKISDDGRKRFDNILNGLVQQNRESKSTNQENHESFSSSLTPRREKFDLPNVVSRTDEGLINEKIADSLDALPDSSSISHSGHLYPGDIRRDMKDDRNISRNRSERRVDYDAEIIVLIVVIISILVIVMFMKLWTVQKNVEELIKEDRNRDRYGDEYRMW